MRHFCADHRQGFSLLEIILAVAMFTIFATGISMVILGGYKTNRLGNELSIASLYASEGLEAARSIKNTGYANLSQTAGTGIIPGASGSWQYSGTNNVLGKFTRVIAVEQVQRDGSGNIVQSGGTIDADTRRVVSTVNWNYDSTSPQSVSLQTYVTNWSTALSDGILVYNSAAAAQRPYYRTFVNQTGVFNAQTVTSTSFTDAAPGSVFKIKSSPVQQQAIAGYVTTGGELRILCTDGANWSDEWTATVGGTGQDIRFGIAYENGTGDVLVVYSTNTATTNELAYRTKSGSSGCGSANWSAQTTFDPQRTSGVVQWIQLEGSAGLSSNTIALAWGDANSDLSAMVWTGSGFTVAEPATIFENNLDRVGATQDSLSFDIGIESTSGDIMLVWSQDGTNCTTGTNCIRYATYTTSWSAGLGVPTVADRAGNIDLAADPASNRMVVVGLSISASDLSAAHWSGTAWNGFANLDTSAGTPIAGSKLVSAGWLQNGANTRYILSYMDNTGTGISWYVGNGTTAPTRQTDFNPGLNIGNPKRWIELVADRRNPDRLLTITSDTNSDLFAKRLVMSATATFTWSETEGGTALSLDLPLNTYSPFGFTFWSNP